MHTSLKYGQTETCHRSVQLQIKTVTFDLTRVFEILGAAAGLAAILVVIFPRQERKYAALLFGGLAVLFLSIDYWQIFYVHRRYIDYTKDNILEYLKGNTMTREQILEHFYRLNSKDLDEALNDLSSEDKIVSRIEDAHLDAAPNPAIKATVFTSHKSRR